MESYHGGLLSTRQIEALRGWIWTHHRPRWLRFHRCGDRGWGGIQWALSASIKQIKPSKRCCDRTIGMWHRRWISESELSRRRRTLRITWNHLRLTHIFRRVWETESSQSSRHWWIESLSMATVTYKGGMEALTSKISWGRFSVIRHFHSISDI